MLLVLIPFYLFNHKLEYVTATKLHLLRVFNLYSLKYLLRTYHLLSTWKSSCEEILYVLFRRI